MKRDTPIVSVDDATAALIAHFYEAATDSTGWTGVASTIATAMQSSSAVLKLQGPGDAVRLMDVTNNLEVSVRRQAWAMHWHREDLWVKRSAAFRVSRIVTDLDLVTPEEQRNSGFYQEWLRELDIHHMVGVVFPVNDGGLGVLGIHRPRRAGVYSNADRQKVAMLLPHLQRALWLSQKLSAAVLHRATMESLLERIDAGVFVVDQHRRLMTLNAQGQNMLCAANGLLDRHHHLTLADASLDARLARLVSDAVATASGITLPAQSTLMVGRNGRLPLTLLVSPFHSGGAAAMRESPGSLAMVIVRDPENSALSKACLRELFDFTRTEAMVANDLAAGLSVDRIAAARGIGTSTVRSHLKQILSKTGTHRLAEAVALIIRSVAGLDRR